MKKISAALLTAVALLSLVSCKKYIGEGPVYTETRTTGSFSRVEFGVPGDFEYIPSDRNEIVIEAQQNIINLIETRLSGNELKLGVRNYVNLGRHERIRITVKGPSVNEFSINGSGNLSVVPALQGSTIRFEVHGSGNIRAEKVEAENLYASIDGSGKIMIVDGSAGHENIAISGSGNIDLLGVDASNVRTETSGSGSTKVWAGNNLDVSISGSGSVFYKGSPAISTHISGSGSVIRLQ